MSDILKVQQELDEISKLRVEGARKAKVRLLFQDTVFILDYSDSMNGMLPDGKTAIDHLEATIKELEIADNMCISFSNFVQRGVGIHKSDRGSTRLHLAFNFVREQYTGLTKIVLISDGEPNSTDAAIEAALKLKLPINVIYIGKKGDKGEKFMELLARKTNGETLTVVGETSLLKEGIVKLLSEKAQ